MIIQRFGLTNTLIAFPVLMLVCTVLVWVAPNLWTVFAVMMVIKGMTYALQNPTKEILYQMTSTNIKFKCKSWIDTFGQRSSKAAGSLITNQFATSIVELTK
jgi:AAA family ATP:ADP antiporter